MVGLNSLTLSAVTVIPHVMKFLFNMDTAFENCEQGGNELVVKTCSGC